jgi:predicted CoA-binding protein
MGKPVVAIIGASADRSKFGNKAVRAYVEMGWDVIPVNLRRGTIEGIPAVASIREISVPIDRVSIYLPPEQGIRILAEIAEKKPREFLVNPGAESPELLAEAERLGLNPSVACSIVDIGRTPAEFASS